MALTAREWLLLPADEQQWRKDELSAHECYLLRTELEYIHLTEEEKSKISPEEKEAFLHPQKRTKAEKEAFNQQCQEIFKRLSEEAKKKH
nr:MAG TPA: hypothetical protein [Caudoviricetes sp.]